MRFLLYLLLCSLSAECGSVFVDLALYLAVGRLCLGGAFLLSYLSRASSTSGTDSSAAYPCCVELFHAPSFSFSQARLLSARDLQHRTWRPALLSARGLHHCIRRLSCGLLEDGHRHVLDLAASHRLGHLCLLLHWWSHCSVPRNIDLFLKLFDITSTRSFQGVLISSGTFLL